jgi:hypothetical protein
MVRFYLRFAREERFGRTGLSLKNISSTLISLTSARRAL